MNRKMSFWLWTAAALWWALPVGAAPFRATLETDAIVISGVTLKGQVVLLGVTREIGEDDFHTVRRHLEVLADEDGDGTVRYPIAGGIPLRSLWAVADLTSGEYDALAPAELGLRRVNWRGRGLQRRPDGKDAVEDRRPRLELLLVRPQVGAWTLRVNDGDASDGDGIIDGRLEGILDRMRPLASSPQPPSVFQRDDLVVALDPAAMEITLFKVAKGF
jgi:hypothetical protein